MSGTMVQSFKVVLIGNPTVGKTSLRRQFMGEKFQADYLATLGVNFASKHMPCEFAKCVLQIWDIAGQFGYVKIKNAYYRGTQGIILVFDLTNMNSLNSLVGWVIEFLEINNNKMVPIVLLGNKSDLVDQNNPLINEIIIGKTIREIRAEILKVTDDVEITYFETSAKLNIEVEEAFTKLFNIMTKTIPSKK